MQNILNDRTLNNAKTFLEDHIKDSILSNEDRVQFFTSYANNANEITRIIWKIYQNAQHRHQIATIRSMSGFCIICIGFSIRFELENKTYKKCTNCITTIVGCTIIISGLMILCA